MSLRNPGGEGQFKQTGKGKDTMGGVIIVRGAEGPFLEKRNSTEGRWTVQNGARGKK